ncbi:DUF6148 family protein [Rhizobium sp. Leaf386]|uniref:DUF6148 family protein n=1 Tax=Rhizobium sp. Leaf386 TaxID=1736359 RepID=UPI000715A7BE|nr:DUF6148 family protein [Rhizobium sp. Leaf386]KQS90308.1 hypothetical protein ASG50_07580 [Rhizobium sp. Leaf386]
MPGLTLEQAQAQLDLWVAADAAVSKKQSYSIAGRSLSLADAGTITEKIDYWSRKVSSLSASSTGRGRVRYGVAE